MTTGASSEDLIGKACSPYTVQRLENNRTLAQSTVKSVMASGDTKWFFLTPDFVFGHQMEAAARQAIQTLVARFPAASSNVIMNEYIRKVAMVDGRPPNVVVETIPNTRDPG